MTNPDLQIYYDKLMAFYKSGVLRSLPNNDRRHNATILCFLLDTSNEINMYCGEMSIFREKFYSYVGNGGDTLKEDVIGALNAFVQRQNVKLNIIVENYNDNLYADLISRDAFRSGIKSDKICIRKLNKNAAVTEGLSHSVYTETKCVRIEEDVEKHSAMFLANMSEILCDKFKSNYQYLTQSSDPVNIAV